MINCYEIYAGLNDKDEKRQLFSTDIAEKAVKTYLQNNFEGSTLAISKGLYKHENGQRVTENTIVIKLLDAPENNVITLCEYLKKLLNQESIMLQKTAANVSFI